MKVKFLMDHCGRETNMREMKAGEEMEMIHSAALELIACGVVEEMGAPKPTRRRTKEVVNVENSQ